jgi:hypothetical protein
MVIYVIYIENEEEVEVEEELHHHHLKTHRSGSAFILTFVEQSPTPL